MKSFTSCLFKPCCQRFSYSSSCIDLKVNQARVTSCSIWLGRCCRKWDGTLYVNKDAESQYTRWLGTDAEVALKYQFWCRNIWLFLVMNYYISIILLIQLLKVELVLYALYPVKVLFCLMHFSGLLSSVITYRWGIWLIIEWERKEKHSAMHF